MGIVTVSLGEADVNELKMIVTDGDEREALRFLKEGVLVQILKRERRKLDAEGKNHL